MTQPQPKAQRPSPPLPPPIRPRPPRLRQNHRLNPPPSRAKDHPKPRGKRSHLPIRRELSAGGVVARREGQDWLVAVLKTEHKRGLVWVLPKGHVEQHTNEKISDAARREVEEETGVRNASVKEQLGVTRFRFQAEDAVVAKTVHYFLMTTEQKQLTPQVEEGLLEAVWAPAEQAISLLEYDTDQEVVARAYERLTGRRLPLPKPPRQKSRSRPPQSRRRQPRPRTGGPNRAPRIHS